MSIKGQGNKVSPLDLVTNEQVSEWISQVGEHQPIEIARKVGLSDGRINQILRSAEEKVRIRLARRGITVKNFQDILPTGDMDTSYWK